MDEWGSGLQCGSRLQACAAGNCRLASTQHAARRSAPSTCVYPISGSDSAYARSTLSMACWPANEDSLGDAGGPAAARRWGGGAGSKGAYSGSAGAGASQHCCSAACRSRAAAGRQAGSALAPAHILCPGKVRCVSFSISESTSGASVCLGARHAAAAVAARRRHGQPAQRAALHTRQQLSSTGRHATHSSAPRIAGLGTPP